MDKFDSLRNSIRQILEQEEQLGRMSPEELKRLRLSLAAQPQIGQDDVEVKDTPPVVDEKAIDDILYRNKYKIGYVEYNGLMHLLCVLKVYGQNNPLPQDLKDFINLVKDYTLGLFDRQQQGLAASHNINNKNRLVEADSDAIYELEKHIKIIINHIYKDSDVKVKKLRSDNVANAIKQANNIISSGLGFFTEILFYTYLSNPTIWANQLEEFNALQTVFDLRLDNLKTSAGTYNACVDFAVMYFLLLDVENKDKRSLHAKLYDYMRDERWNSRQEDVDTLAEAWSYAFSDPLDHCIEILKKLQNKFDNSKWEPGQAESETRSGHPQYDLWLVESKNNDSKVIRVIRAKIDIKSYLPNSLIAPTKTSHSKIGEADFFGFINFERKQRPFIETEISNLEYTIKYLIIKKDEVKNLIKQSIKDENEGKTYKNIFALGHGDPYHPKEYSAEDLSSQTDPFTLQYYESNLRYKVRKEVDDNSFSLSDNDTIGDVSLDKDLIEKYFDLNLRGKGQSGSHPTNRRIQNFKSKLKEIIASKLNNCPEYPIKDTRNPSTPRNTISNQFENYAEILQDSDIPPKTLRHCDFYYIDFNTLDKILKESIKETINEVGKVSLFKYTGDTSAESRYSLLKHVIFKTLIVCLENDKDKIHGTDPTDYKNKKSVLLALLTKYFTDKQQDGFYKKLEDNYQALASLHPKKIVESHTCTASLLRNVIRNILEEGDKKKSYSGSHPEESYGWSAKEEDFMFDLPGLTTWEEDRQWVKEYLKSMGMLKNKK